MQSPVGKENEFENKDLLTILLTKSKQYIYERNYQLTSRSNINFFYAAILYTIHFIQFYVLISLPTYNLAITKDNDMYFLVEKGIILLTKVNIETELKINQLTIMGLCGIQILITLAYLVPVKGHQLNIFISKYIIQLFSITCFIPSVFISTQNLLNFQSVYISMFTILLTLINRLFFITMHFQYSIRGLSQNILIRNPFSTSTQLVTFFFLILFLLCKYFLYPTSLIIYFTINILYSLFQVKKYCIGFNYHHESMTKLMGILEIMKTSIFLCYVIVIATQITLVKNNILTFIGAFFFFFANFFLIFKKYATKRIVIDSENDDETKKIIFIMWYFTCFRNRAEKKNQLYLSSLLKNHSSQCSNLTCCCRKRNQIYDPSTNTFGSPESQPHQDLVYIKHFFLKILTETYKSFPKSNQVLFILAFYYLQILNFIPQTISLIKQLKKKSLKNNLTFSEDYVLYCLGERCFQKIKEINNLKGNLNLQKVRAFDLKIMNLKETIKFSVDTFASLWKTICSQRYNQKNLVQICKVALQVMFKIEENYKEIKMINSVSTQLKELMIFYSKSVAHDIHLLSEIRKEIKLDSEKAILSNLTEVKEINIFSPDTITLVTSQISNIRWASKNCYSIFGYNSREEFLRLKINDLMPKFFSENHDSYIQKWLQTGHSSKLNKCSYLWGSTKDGYCFSIGFYVKIIPLQKQQDFAFFAAIQKIDIQNEIICNQQGQILGCGKQFSSTIKCSQKTLQQYKPNIQFFLPSTFEIFIEGFFPERKPTYQLFVQNRRQGYFPKHLQNVIKDFSKDKQTFFNKYKIKLNFKQLYSNFLKQKMQQITVNMGGQYISLITTVHELNIIEKGNKKIIVLKITGIRKNNVQKYYNELQKMITRIEQFFKERKNEKNKNSLKTLKSLKKDYFKVFLNPKRVMKILQQENQERLSEQHLTFDRLNPILQKGKQKNQIQKSISSSNHSQQKIIDHRKKLALGAQYEIKGERAKYNIWKMKKVLLQEGIFSRYTYNMLLGKRNDFGSIQQLNKSIQKIDETFISGVNYEHEIGSDDQLTSNNLTNKQKLQNQDKIPNDKQTFNSATSSAAFISMTNSIKMFKMKLRSLNTPKLLYWLNIGLIFLIMLVSGFQVWLWIEETKQTEIGQIYFSHGIESSWVIDSLLMGKLMTQKLVHLQNFSSSFTTEEYNKAKTDLTRMRNIYVDRMQDILSVQLLDFAHLQSKDPLILKYLFLEIPLNQTLEKGSQITYLQALEFMMRQQDYSKLGFNVINPSQTKTLLEKHKNIYETNSYYQKLQNIDQNLFLAGLLTFIVAFTVTIPIVYKIQSKVEQIIQLISKISLNQRKKYYLQFTILSEELKKLTQTQSWAELQNIQQVKLNKTQLKINQSTLQTQKNSQKSPLISKNQQKPIKVKFYQTIFFKIIIIYLVYLFVCCSKFIYIKIIFDQFIQENYVYTKIMFQKLKMTQNSLNFNQFITKNQSFQIQKTQLVNQIYNSYHLSDKNTSNYDDFLLNVTTGNICNIINETISSINDSHSFMEFFKFSSNSELDECQSLHDGSLTKGLFSTLDYIEQKRIFIVNQQLEKRLNFLKSFGSIQIQKSLYYSSIMTYLIQRQIRFQIQRKKEKLIFQMGLWLIIVSIILFLFTLAWIFIYLNIAERASYINAFLLLIPYDVLSENPYIKLYIKNQFDYKASIS